MAALDKDNEAQLPQWKGSVPSRAANLDRSRDAGHVQLYPETALYRAYFWHRFWISRRVFERIIEGDRYHNPYFQCRPDATSKLGLSSDKKCSASIRMLAYGAAGDLVDEYMRMSESRCIESIYKCCRAIIVVFGSVYLREPTMEDT
jgi:hypothetical protein